MEKVFRMNRRVAWRDTDWVGVNAVGAIHELPLRLTATRDARRKPRGYPHPLDVFHLSSQRAFRWDGRRLK